MKLIWGVSLLAISLGASSAWAEGGLEEFRFGVAAHDLSDHTEDGPQITLEGLFTSPDFLEWAYSPRPYLQASISTQGNTNWLASGLAWNWGVSERLDLEASFGLSIHDGYLDVPDDNPQKAIYLKENRALLGSRVLFRTSLGADYALNDQWRVGVFWEHHSHGQILASGRNQGFDEIGLRLGYRFGR